MRRTSQRRGARLQENRNEPSKQSDAKCIDLSDFDHRNSHSADRLGWCGMHVRWLEKAHEPALTPGVETQTVGTMDLHLSDDARHRIFSASGMLYVNGMSWWRPIGSEYLYLRATLGGRRWLIVSRHRRESHRGLLHWKINATKTLTVRMKMKSTCREPTYTHSVEDIVCWATSIWSQKTDWLRRGLYLIYRVVQAHWSGRFGIQMDQRCQSRWLTTVARVGEVLVLTSSHCRLETTELASENASLNRQGAIAFSKDGSRLFLIDDKTEGNSELAEAGRAIVVFDQQTGKQTSTKFSNLPPMLPLAISDDAKWVAYAFPANVEIWNTEKGEKTTTLLAQTDGGWPWQTLKAKFLAGGDLIALADRRILGVYETNREREPFAILMFRQTTKARYCRCFLNTPTMILFSLAYR